MFLLFNCKLYNVNAIKLIKRVVSEDKTTDKPWGICLNEGDDFEYFISKQTRDGRFNTISEQVGATSERGY